MTPARLSLLLSLALLAGCSKSVTATQLMVVVHTDLDVGTQLTRITAHLMEPDTQLTGVLPDQDVRSDRSWIVADMPLGPEKQLPLSFGIVPQGDDASRRIRLVVTGYGPLGNNGAEIPVVQDMVKVGFREHESLLLEVFLWSNCFRQLCEAQRATGADAICASTTGDCNTVPDITDLPITPPNPIRNNATPNGINQDAGLGGSGGSLSCSPGNCSNGGVQRPNPDGGCPIFTCNAGAGGQAGVGPVGGIGGLGGAAGMGGVAGAAGTSGIGGTGGVGGIGGTGGIAGTGGVSSTAPLCTASPSGGTLNRSHDTSPLPGVQFELRVSSENGADVWIDDGAHVAPDHTEGTDHFFNISIGHGGERQVVVHCDDGSSQQTVRPTFEADSYGCTTVFDTPSGNDIYWLSGDRDPAQSGLQVAANHQAPFLEPTCAFQRFASELPPEAWECAIGGCTWSEPSTTNTGASGNVTVSADTRSIVLEGRDGAGNVTRSVIPVSVREEIQPGFITDSWVVPYGYTLQPFDAVADAAGNITIVGSLTVQETGAVEKVVVRYNASGEELWHWGENAGGTERIQHAAVLSESGAVWMAGRQTLGADQPWLAYFAPGSTAPDWEDDGADYRVNGTPFDLWVSSLSIGNDGVVYATASNSNRLHRFDASTGARLGSVALPAPIASSPVATAAGDNLIVAGATGTGCAPCGTVVGSYTGQGVENWSVVIDEAWGWANRVAFDGDDTVYVVLGRTLESGYPRSALTAYGLDGTLRMAPVDIVGYDQMRDLAADMTGAYVAAEGTANDAVLKFSPSGTLLWSRSVTTNDQFRPLATTPPGPVFAVQNYRNFSSGSSQTSVYALQRGDASTTIATPMCPVGTNWVAPDLCLGWNTTNTATCPNGLRPATLKDATRAMRLASVLRDTGVLDGYGGGVWVGLQNGVWSDGSTYDVTDAIPWDNDPVGSGSCAFVTQDDDTSVSSTGALVLRRDDCATYRRILCEVP